MDLACGTGTLAVWLKRSQPRALITVADGDLHILAIAQGKAQRADAAVHFQQLCYRLPFLAARFDRLVCSLRHDDALQCVKKLIDEGSKLEKDDGRGEDEYGPRVRHESASDGPSKYFSGQTRAESAGS